MIYDDERDVVYFTDAAEIKMLTTKKDFSDAKPRVWIGAKSEDDGVFATVHPLVLKMA